MEASQAKPSHAPASQPLTLPSCWPPKHRLLLRPQGGACAPPRSGWLLGLLGWLLAGLAWLGLVWLGLAWLGLALARLHWLVGLARSTMIPTMISANSSSLAHWLTFKIIKLVWLTGLLG